MKKLLPFLFLISAFASHAQTWEIVRGIIPAAANSNFQVRDLAANGGKLYVVGQFAGSLVTDDINVSSKQSDGILLQVDTSGKVDWYVTLTGTGDADFFSVAINSGGTVYIGGHYSGAAEMTEQSGTSYDLGVLGTNRQEGVAMKVLNDGTIDEIITTTWNEQFTMVDLDVGPNNDVLALGMLKYRTGEELAVMFKAEFGSKVGWTKSFVSTREVQVNSLSISSKGFATVAGSYVKNINFTGGNDDWIEKEDEVEEGFLAIFDAATGSFQNQFSLVNQSPYSAIDVETAGDFIHIAWKHEGELQITANDGKNSRGQNDIMVTRIGYNPTGGNPFVLYWYFGYGSSQNISKFNLIKGEGNELYVLAHDVGTMYFDDDRLSTPAGTNALLIAVNPSGKRSYESVIENTNMNSGLVGTVAGDGYPYIASSNGQFGTAELGWFNVDPARTMLYLAKNSDAEKHRRADVEKANKNVYSLYPNPSNGLLYGSLISEAVGIEILDLTGRVVYSTASSMEVLNIEHLVKGSYVMRAQLENGSSVVRKVLVE